MKKPPLKHIILLVVITLLLWLWGAGSFLITAPDWFPWLANIMGDLNERENLFAPVAAFFSGLSALATVYLIWLQMQNEAEHDKNVQIERVLSHFFNLLEYHKSTLDDVIYPIRRNPENRVELIQGQTAVKHFIESIHYALYMYSRDNTNKQPNMENIYREIQCDINKLSPESHLNLPINQALKFGFEAIDQHTDQCLQQYFHNIYVMLRLLYDNRSLIDIDVYMRTLRAELSQNEFLLIYYHACYFEDTHSKEKSFKKLIEKTCFFHSLSVELLDKDPMTRKPHQLYEKSAFEHDSQ